MPVLPAVVSEDNYIYVFLAIGGRMPSRNSCHTPSTVLSGSLHIKGYLLWCFRPTVGGRDFCQLNTIVQQYFV